MDDLFAVLYEMTFIPAMLIQVIGGVDVAERLRTDTDQAKPKAPFARE